MKETTKEFLQLFFEPGERICVSPDKFAYFSIDQSELNNDKINLLSNNAKNTKTITEDDINLMAINPINGPRNDNNVTSFRSFLVELDEGREIDQLRYIEESGLPYSVCVFSGNKSLHFGIVLDRPCSCLSIWRHLNKWILNILDKADQQTLNPSRSIRFPGNKRRDGRKLLQAIVKSKGRISREELDIWLNKHPDKKPKPKIRKYKPNMVYSYENLKKMPKWIKDCFYEGVHVDRNNTWFNIACWFAKNGADIDSFYRTWEDVFEEERDFSRREWETAIKSAFKRIQG